MRLPGIPRGQVQQLIAPKADLSEAHAAMSLGRALGDVSQAALNIQMNTWRREEEQNDRDMKESVINMKAEVFETDFYSGDNIPADAVGKLNVSHNVVDQDGQVQNVPRTNIPAAEVWGAIYEERINKTIESLAGNMSHQGAQEAWVQNMQTRAKEDLFQMEQVLDRDQQEQYRALQETNAEMYLDNRMYDDAREVYQNLSGAEEWEKSAALRIVDKKEELGDINDELVIARETGDTAKLEELADYYNPENENVTAFDSVERDQYHREIVNQISNIRSRGTSEVKLRNKQLEYDLNQAREVLATGKNVDPDDLIDLQNRLTLSDALDPNVAFTAKMRFKQAMEVNDQVRGLIMSHTPEEVQAMINDDSIPHKTIGDQDIYNDVVTSYNTFIKSVRSDGMQAMDDYDVMDIEALDYGSAESLGESLQLRERQWREARERFNMVAPMLGDDEQSLLGNHIDELQGVNERLAFISTMSNSISPEMNRRFWSSLTDNKNVGPYAVIGNLIQENATRGNLIGRDILNGIDAIKRDPSILENVSFMKDTMKVDMGAGYANYLSDVRDNYVEAAMAYLAVNMPKHLDDGATLTEETMREALNTVTGGIIQYEGATFIAPQHGMSEDTFSEWLNNVHASYIDELGGVQDYANSGNMLSLMRDGDIVLLPTGHDRTTFYLQDTRKNYQNVRDKDGKAFIFRYNPDAPKRNRDG